MNASPEPRSPPAAGTYCGKRVTVMGLGRFGGGVAAARFLAERGARVTVTDLLGESELQESLRQLDGCSLAELHLGGHRDRDFMDADLIVVNPAVPRNNRYLELARRCNVPLTSEMNLFWQHNRGRIIGVTGTTGKSTTAAMIHSILQAASGWPGRDGPFSGGALPRASAGPTGLRSGRCPRPLTGKPQSPGDTRCWLGGNIGTSLLPVVDEITPNDWVVLELSSFQLEDLDRLQVSPHMAVVTNFRPNHLDRHGTVESYWQAKQTILRWQKPDDIAVLNAEDPDVSQWPTRGRVVCVPTVTWFPSSAWEPMSSKLRFDDQEAELPEGAFPSRAWERDNQREWAIRIPGQHNRVNARLAASAAEAIGVPDEAIREGLQKFTGLPHRLQFVGEVHGRRFYNDSKATTPDAVIAALQAFSEPVILLAGGSDKGIDLSPLADAIAKRTKVVALMGQTAETLAERLKRGRDFRSSACSRSRPPDGTFNRNRRPNLDRGPAGPSGPTPPPHSPAAEPAVRMCSSFDEAFRWATAQSQSGDVILLSPGCAAYDWFRNFAERGERFVELVHWWTETR